MEEYLRSVAEGTLQLPEPEECAESVSYLRDDKPLRRFEQVLEGVEFGE